MAYGMGILLRPEWYQMIVIMIENDLFTLRLDEVVFHIRASFSLLYDNRDVVIDLVDHRRQTDAGSAE